MLSQGLNPHLGAFVFVIFPIISARFNAHLVGVGLERLGVGLFLIVRELLIFSEEFVEGKYWDGPLYIDDGKKSYKALTLKVTTTSLQAYLLRSGEWPSGRIRLA